MKNLKNISLASMITIIKITTIFCLIFSLSSFTTVKSQFDNDSTAETLWYNNGSCYSALDIVQLQDMTSSFDLLWPAMSNVGFYYA